MRKILQIINKNLGPDGFSDQEFKGSVYFQGENGLDIDKSEYIKLLDYFNNALKTSGGSVTPNDDLLVGF
ncbi:hypothetical protein [Formosa algae]|uniref:hypothetical protein n=1 Tax=Formosa algae TaxID=225843 RepID=UPI000CCF53F3|nr:hypothetical protein [Formosa algae]PNW26112.1 hypothetical protein BKP44_18040 [Formosa algae]